MWCKSAFSLGRHHIARLEVAEGLKKRRNSPLAEVWATDYSLRVLLLVVEEVAALLDITVKLKRKYIPVQNRIYRVMVIA